MRALIKLLWNFKKNTWHPIYYLEASFLGGYELNTNHEVVRYKSKGHLTTGLPSRQEALDLINEDLLPKLNAMASKVLVDVTEDIPWDGDTFPVDIQLYPN